MKFLATSLALLALSTGAPPDSTRAVDLDGDGRLDLVRLTRGELRVDWNLGQRAFQPGELELPPLPITAFLVEDLNADGRPDLYLVTLGANVALVSDGARGFVDATLELGLATAGLGLGVRRIDIDEDGTPDLLLQNAGGDVVFWGRAGGGFERDASISTPAGRARSTGGSGAAASGPGWTLTPGRLPPPLPGPYTAALGTDLPPGSLILWEAELPPSGFEATSWSVKTDPPGAWFPALPMPTARGGAVAGAMEGKVFVLGGSTGISLTDAVEAYSPAGPNWKTGSRMPAPLRDAVSAVVGGRMYVFGGITPAGIVEDVNVLDPATGWAPRAKVPSQQLSPGCAAAGGKIYLIGGATIFAPLDLVREYDPGADQWKTLPSSLPTPRSGLAAAALDGKIYLVGGITTAPVDTVDVYDPATDTFSSAAPLPVKTSSASAVALDGRVFLFTGNPGVFAYDPDWDIWTQEAPPVMPHIVGTAAVLGGRIHLVGGSDGGGGAYSGGHEIYDPGGPRLRVVRKK